MHERSKGASCEAGNLEFSSECGDWTVDGKLVVANPLPPNNGKQIDRQTKRCSGAGGERARGRARSENEEVVIVIALTMPIKRQPFSCMALRRFGPIAHADSLPAGATRPQRSQTTHGTQDKAWGKLSSPIRGHAAASTRPPWNRW